MRQPGTVALIAAICGCMCAPVSAWRVTFYNTAQCETALASTPAVIGENSCTEFTHPSTGDTRYISIHTCTPERAVGFIYVDALCTNVDESLHQDYASASCKTSANTALHYQISCVSPSTGGTETNHGFTLEQILIIVLIGSAAFVLGAAITGGIMLVIWAPKGADGKRRRRKRGPSKKKENIDDMVTDAVQQEEKFNMATQRAQTRRRESLNSRLEIRKQQAEMKLKRSKALEQVSLFAGYSSEQLGAIVKGMRFDVFEDGTCICEEGTPADRMYFIVQGAATVTGKNGPFDDTESQLNRLESYSWFGEGAMVKDDAVRTASCYAEGQVETMSLGRSKYKALIDSGILDATAAEIISSKAKEYENEASDRNDIAIDLDDEELVDLEDVDGANEV